MSVCLFISQIINRYNDGPHPTSPICGHLGHLGVISRAHGMHKTCVCQINGMGANKIINPETNSKTISHQRLICLKYTPKAFLTSHAVRYNIVSTMFTQNLFQAGNSQVVAIPKELFDDLGFKKGQKVTVDKTDGAIVIKKSVSQKAAAPASRTEFKKWLDNVLKEDAGILDELANR